MSTTLPTGAKIINGVKTFIPLENNPTVHTHLATALSIQTLAFHDIFTLDPPPTDETDPIWIPQTIGHACGLMAFLHCVLNLDAGAHLARGSDLAKLRDELVSLAPEDRARVVYEALFLEEAHMDAARGGSSGVPGPEEHNGFHFLGFVKGKDGRVWELNGGMPGPLESGVLGDGEDLVSEAGLRLTVGDFLEAAREVEGGGYGGLGVSLVGLVGV
ncbi:ubiquitin carboxyl-terminal hydrolase isozyme L3 [Aspergillus nomiae NRRL 13137]|uniref:ubiquitinyl hydrolase 1 n=1 Tax=Aspergillus nomiae NRRL (strain ATCC 15546 / NRRL 13137 / CBS 260.88 / M93) TaxID=1509407 RepID=A0A0L1IX67_ASPN3|nr:ubiquitin carboxyl-terminal hydrolase isozyme L3 [Aspergillus nomiae NRRL 13137]KNG83995.1 ubiquitin carboxyl-terminal hydrolase isozyme L3 [Aspergillus nomiae NRRL 13137]